jgi:hypothetical protein
MTRSADNKRARFLEAQHSPGVPVTTTRPVRVQGRASANGALTVAAGRVVGFFRAYLRWVGNRATRTKT